MSDELNNKSTPDLPSMGPDKGELRDSEVQEIHAQLGREKAEPSEGSAYPPLFIIFICMILCLWAGFEISHSSGGFKWDVYDPAGGSAVASGPVVYDPIKKGKRVYTNKCQVCHQQSGAGVPGVYPPLAGSDWMAKSDDILVRIVLNGLAGDIVVNGQTYNNAMTAFGGELTDKQIAEVLSYIRNSWGNAYPIVEESSVAAIRADVGSRSTTYTAAELLEAFPE